jgi:heat shock protein HslJ
MYSIYKSIALISFLIPSVILLSCKAQEVSLHSTKWKLIRLGSENTTALKEPITLVFNEDQSRISGFGGCNRYFGTCQLSGNRITISGTGSTKMFCEETMRYEDTFFRLLSEVETFQVKNGHLQLMTGNKKVLELVKSE